MTPQQAENLKAAAPAAKQAAAKLNLPSSFSLLALAQWVFESQWGLHQSGFNFLGLKASPSTPADQRQLLHTQEHFTPQELQNFLAGDPNRTAQLHPGSTPDSNGRALYDVQDWFLTFPSLEACFEKHATLLSTGAPYKPAFAQFQQSHDIFQLAEGIAQHYSTTPTYGTQLVGMMRSDVLTQALNT